MGSWKVDTSRWPIVIQTVDGTLLDAQVDELIAAGTEVLLRGIPYITVMDASRIGKATAYTRARAIEWQRIYASELRKHCLGTVYVLTSPVLRFIAMTVIMVTRLPTPLHIAKSLEEGLVWAQQRLDEHSRAQAP